MRNGNSVNGLGEAGKRRQARVIVLSDKPGGANHVDRATVSRAALRDHGEAGPPGAEREAQASSADGANRGHGTQKSAVYRVSRVLARASGWVLTLVIGSLLVPAVTKQWTDRPKELELKNSLVTQISEASTQTVVSGTINVSGLTPERRVSRNLYNHWRDIADKVDKEAAWQKYQEAESSAEKAEQQAINEALASWQKHKITLKAQLDVYFPQTDLARDWVQYMAAMRAYMALSMDTCGRERMWYITTLARYIDNKPFVIDWKSLGNPSRDRNCRTLFRPPAQVAYVGLGENLLARQDSILSGIMKADTTGYSNGWADLIRDVF